jgi:hypothetical protein
MYMYGSKHVGQVKKKKNKQQCCTQKGIFLEPLKCCIRNLWFKLFQLYNFLGDDSSALSVTMEYCSCNLFLFDWTVF